MNKEYYTVSEFAEITGTTKQAVYKRLKAGLKNYVKVIDGVKVISAEALDKQNIQPVDKPVDKTVVEPVETIEKSSVSTNPEQPKNNPVVEPVDKPSETSILIDMLNRQLDILNKQLETKDKQIEALNDRLGEAFKTIDSQNLLLNQQQHLALLDKTGGQMPDKEEPETEPDDTIIEVGPETEDKENTVETDLELHKDMNNENENKGQEKKKGLFGRIFR